jgi:hypothetical protein
LCLFLPLLRRFGNVELVEWCFYCCFENNHLGNNIQITYKKQCTINHVLFLSILKQTSQIFFPSSNATSSKSNNNGIEAPNFYTFSFIGQEERKRKLHKHIITFFYLSNTHAKKGEKRTYGRITKNL